MIMINFAPIENFGFAIKRSFFSCFDFLFFLLAAAGVELSASAILFSYFDFVIFFLSFHILFMICFLFMFLFYDLRCGVTFTSSEEALLIAPAPNLPFIESIALSSLSSFS